MLPCHLSLSRSVDVKDASLSQLSLGFSHTPVILDVRVFFFFFFVSLFSSSIIDQLDKGELGGENQRRASCKYSLWNIDVIFICLDLFFFFHW